MYLSRTEFSRLDASPGPSTTNVYRDFGRAMRLPVTLLATLRSTRPIRSAMSRNVSSESAQAGPVETSIRQKVKVVSPQRFTTILICCSSLQLNELFKPTALEISNDSAQHRHHTAMRAQGGGNGETRKSQLFKC